VRSLSAALFQSYPGSAALNGLSDDAAEFWGLPAYFKADGPFAQTQVLDWKSEPKKGMKGWLMELEALCHPSDGDFGSGPDAFVMASRPRMWLKKEFYDAGVNPDYRVSPLTGKMHLHCDGIPVLTGRVRETGLAGLDELHHGTPSTEVWALKLTGPSAIRILHSGGDSKNFGIRMASTPTQIEGADVVAQGAPSIEVFGVYSLIVPEVQSVARLINVPLSVPTWT
jgi:hypothetical protein